CDPHDGAHLHDTVMPFGQHQQRAFELEHDVPQWEATSRMSACEARGGAGDRPGVGEHAAGVPGWEGSCQRRGPVELDAAVTGDLGPGELAGVPFDEGFGLRRDVEVLVEAGVRLADLGVSELDE